MFSFVFSFRRAIRTTAAVFLAMWFALGAVSAQDAVETPSLAINLAEISDWTTQHPFINVARTARPWFGHLEGRWGGVSNEQLRATRHVDPNGWPLAIPENVTKLETLFFTDQPPELQSIRGRYRITYGGDVDVVLSGPARNISYGDGEIWFDYPETAGGGIGFGLTRINPADPLRSLTIVHESNLLAHEVGAIFNPVWVDLVKDFRGLRFMPWMAVNNTDLSDWKDAPTESAFSYRHGVPLSVMIDLANLIGADPWFTLPHTASDSFAQEFAKQVKRDLDPRLKAYVEYSNEVWNFQFVQARWAEEQAKQLWGNRAGGNAWIQYAGLRAAEIAQMFSDVFGSEANTRLANVVAVHTAWIDLADVQLEGHLISAELDAPISKIFDAYAVTGYLRPDNVEPGFTQALQGWLDQGGKDYAFEMIEKSIRDSRLDFLANDAWPAHADRAEKHGLDLIMYEGGTHVVYPHGEPFDQALSEVLIDFNYSSNMQSLYQDLLLAWSDNGGRLFNPYVDVLAPSRWGSWGHLRHLDDTTTRWDTIIRANAFRPDTARATSDFGHGNLNWHTGSHIGSDYNDILIGTSNDDVFEATSGHDLIHGGEGFDQLLIGSPISDFSFQRVGAVSIAKSAKQEIHFAGIEYLFFMSDGLAIAPEDLID